METGGEMSETVAFTLNSAFSIVLAIATGMITFWLRNINEEQKEFRHELQAIRDTYQRRDDAHREFQQIMAMLQRIEQKLDKKADK